MAGARKAITTDKAAPPGAHYSQGIVAGDHVYISGSGPFEPGTHKLVGDDIAVQTRATMRNIAAILESAGASLADVVQVTVYLKDIDDFEDMNAEYRKHFPTDPPARTAVAVAGMRPAGRLLVMDAVAWIGGRR
jgi:2-iminobutanoate/2-iminopropanoate deaminase